MHQILRPNTDPHEYEPRPDDVRATSGAKVVFENGLGLDGWMGKVVSSAGGDAARRRPRLERRPTSSPATRTGGTTRGTPRPPSRAIRDALVRADPQAARTLRRNADAYLRTAARARLASIAACFATRAARRSGSSSPTTTRSATSRARYGIHVVGAVIPSLTTQAQPSAGETAKLIRLVRREHVHAVFPESSLNARLAQTIARATGRLGAIHAVRRHARRRGQTYLQMERANADAMVRGFTGGRRGCGT